MNKVWNKYMLFKAHQLLQVVSYRQWEHVRESRRLPGGGGQNPLLGS